MAISKFPGNIGLATLPMVARDDKMGVFHNALMWYPDRSGQIPLRRLADRDDIIIQNSTFRIHNSVKLVILISRKEVEKCRFVP